MITLPAFGENNRLLPSSATNQPPRQKVLPMQSGKVVTLGIFAIALLATACAWWYQRAQGRRALEYWGADDAQLLRHGKEILLWQLSPDADGPDAANGTTRRETLLVDDLTWSIRRQVDLTKAPGLLHLRQALIVDASYDWDAPTPGAAESPVWQYALAAQDDDRQVVILLDLRRQWARKLDRGPPVQLTIASGLETFFREALDRDGS